jgi:molecular chaperone IbpA
MSNPLNFDPFSFAAKAMNTTVGFDQVFDRLSQLSQNLPKIPTYPPYNIRKVDESKYIIELAVAGFGKQDLELEMADGVLTIKGSTNSDEDNFIYKGIADRAFTRSFTLADSVEIKNADLINGMLKIWIERFIPEEKKSKKIDINEGEKSTKQFLAEKK